MDVIDFPRFNSLITVRYKMHRTKIFRRNYFFNVVSRFIFQKLIEYKQGDIALIYLFEI